MSISPERLEKLSTKQRAVYELLLKKKREETASQDRITPLSRDADSYPLSFAQQRLWVISELYPDTAAYNIPSPVRLRGHLEVQVLERSLREVVRRHETLRTSFVLTRQEPRQIISPNQGFDLPVIDLMTLSDETRENAARVLIEADYNRPFDLQQSPLFRAALLKLDRDEHILMLTMHHIVSDDWSIGVLAREAMMLYETFSGDGGGGRRSPLPELQIQYVDFAQWQRQWLHGAALEKHLAYWDKQLSGHLPKLELPVDATPQAARSFRGATHPLNLPKDLSESLRATGKDEGATLFMTLLAAFQVLLHRYSGQDDIIVGSPIANRTRVEVEALIGFFVNMLVLRTELSGNPGFGELLGRVRDVTLGAYAHQDLPFEQMVERFQPERNLNHTPLFRVAFVLQNGPGPLQSAVEPAAERTGQNGHGLQWSSYGVSRGTAKFDLTLNLHETGDGIAGVLEYSTDLFEATTIERMARHFQNLLQSIVANPRQPIWSLAMLDADEQRQLIGNARTESDIRCRHASIHHMFEEQAQARPDAVALVFADEQVTYGSLNRRANQLANHLRALGVGPETLVGICLEPSTEMIVGILGVLKAGGAYLPLDPGYPTERLSFMLDDARVSLVITKQNLSGGLSGHEAKLVHLDSDAGAIAACSEENPEVGVSMESLAYVIYTSGSTGMPKGVEVVHGNVVRLLAATESRFNFGTQDVWTLFHSYAFDFSVWEIWGALAYGGRLVVVPYWITRTPEAMHHLVRENGVTVLNQTPSAFKSLMGAERLLDEAESATHLRLVIFGGEALDLQSLAGWVERHGDEKPELVNMYGITETTVHVTYKRIRKADVQSNVGSLIGEPISGWQTYLLDREMNLVPQGVTGELYVGGAGVSRGYLNRPGLTAERFLPDACGGGEGRLLYKTGDLGRYRAGGEIEYLGRIDQQVKVRGFRIELSEIAAALNSYDGVEDAVVLAREDKTGDKRLVAYVVSHGINNGVEELRAYLAGKIPKYMIPSAFVLLDAMPLTPNGKLDKHALLATELAQPELNEAYAPPQTPIEEILAGIWAEMLEVERAGIDDNFFALGGDSIRSIQVRSRAAERGLEFSVEQLFQHQTIRELARVSAFAGEPSTKLQTPAFSLISDNDRAELPADLEDAYPLAMLQAGMLFHSEYNPEAVLYHNVSSFRLRAPFIAEHMRAAVQQLVKRHGILRTSFDLHSYSEPLQLVHRSVNLPVEMDDIRDAFADEQNRMVDAFIASEKLRHFAWDSPPLLRFHIHLISNETFQFTMTEHHAILDGWSVASLLTELFRTYLSLLDGSSPASADVPSALAFREYVALERQALTSEECRRFWGERLDGSTPLMLPRPARVEQEESAPRIRIINVPVSTEVSDGLKRFALKMAVPIKSVLLAAHLRVMSIFSGQTDVMTGLISNGRPEETDGERVLGLFLNALPFRSNLAGGTWEELVRQIFDAEREQMPFRRYPMAEMQKNRGGKQLFEVAFNFTHFHVYESLQEVSNVEVLGGVSLAATNFTLGANFSMSLGNDSKVDLVLHCNVAEIGDPLADSLAVSYERILKEITDAPQSRYDMACPLPEAQRRELLIEWNDTRRELPVEQCIHNLFEAQAARTPDAIAILSEHESVTYAGLERRTNELAEHLRSIGIGPEVYVGICIEPSTEMIVGLLGILKAGGAYVPLDPAYPQERLAYILKDVRISTVLTQRRLAAIFANHDVHALSLDDHWQTGTPDEGSRAAVQPGAENLAYIIHTSGSTGNPKGVMISHRALVNHSQTIAGTYGLDSTHRVLQFIAPNFDASAEEIFPVLASGGAIVLHPNPTRVSPTQLLEECVRRGVTTLHLPAVYWYQLEDELEQTGQEVPELIKLVVVGGESPSIERVARWRELTKGRARFFNSYGPTEATITCTSFEALPDGTDGLAKLPIGKPLDNARMYVLDAFLQPAPVGVTGELYIGGLGVARGYINQPELTAQRFIPDPFSSERGERLYKTGDLARYLPDGNIDFLGRADRQLKFRGFRVELGEIEEKLREHVAVQDVVVIVISEGMPPPPDEELTRRAPLKPKYTGDDDKRLVAYVVADASAGEVLEVAELRRHLKSKLPEYMIPQSFVFLDALPFNANGKVERNALPAPGRPTLDLEDTYVAPQTAAEEVIAGIWEQVLGVDKVGVHSNFFELGGHSISATRLVSRMRSVFHVEMPLRAVFETPTIAELAELVEALIISDIESPS